MKPKRVKRVIIGTGYIDKNCDCFVTLWDGKKDTSRGKDYYFDKLHGKRVLIVAEVLK